MSESDFYDIDPYVIPIKYKLDTFCKHGIVKFILDAEMTESRIKAFIVHNYTSGWGADFIRVDDGSWLVTFRYHPYLD